MSDCYIDSSIPEMEDREPIRNPGLKLSASQHPWYEEVRGESGPKYVPERPKEAQPLPLRVKRCSEHRQDDEQNKLGAVGINGLP
jgi:hypothetical protein